MRNMLHAQSQDNVLHRYYIELTLHYTIFIICGHLSLAILIKNHPTSVFFYFYIQQLFLENHSCESQYKHRDFFHLCESSQASIDRSHNPIPKDSPIANPCKILAIQNFDYQNILRLLKPFSVSK